MKIKDLKVGDKIWIKHEITSKDYDGSTSNMAIGARITSSKALDSDMRWLDGTNLNNDIPDWIELDSDTSGSILDKYDGENRDRDFLFTVYDAKEFSEFDGCSGRYWYLIPFGGSLGVSYNPGMYNAIKINETDIELAIIALLKLRRHLKCS